MSKINGIVIPVEVSCRLVSSPSTADLDLIHDIELPQNTFLNIVITRRKSEKKIYDWLDNVFISLFFFVFSFFYIRSRLTSPKETKNP